ncbi:MAG: response regulator [Mangrovibacterium sp.]
MSRELTSLKVLIVDDSPINHKVVAFPLKSTFKEITSAFNGEEGFEHFKATEADVILMDISMPIMDGIQCTQAIRTFEKENNRATPVIILAMTGNESDEDIKEYLAAGMNGCVGKPINKELLLETITDLL